MNVFVTKLLKLTKSVLASVAFKVSDTETEKNEGVCMQ